MELIEFLNKKAEKAELESLRKYPNDDYRVKLSAFARVASTLDLLIFLLADLYELEETETEMFLKPKPTTTK